MEGKPYEMRDNRPRIISFSSGKGGVGKTFLSSNISVLLSRLGRRIILMDGDITGSNIHNVFGIKKSKYSLSDYFKGKCNLEEVIVDSGIENLSVILNSSEFMYTLAIDEQVKSRFFNELRMLDCDNLIMDLSSGARDDVIDLFLLSDVKCAVFNSEPTSVENLYSLIKNSLLRILYFMSRDMQVLDAYIMEEEKKSVNFYEFCKEIENIAPDTFARFEKFRNSFDLKLIHNFVHTEKDIEIAYRLQHVLKKFLKLNSTLIGHIPYSPEVPRSIKAMKPLTTDLSSETAKKLHNLVSKVL